MENHFLGIIGGALEELFFIKKTNLPLVCLCILETKKSGGGLGGALGL
jgi:hypothetical protein